ncbi:MAG: hypothetical protein HYX68_22530 [Planctomycetes bacterium]|nr:hypothetical protein [Planctomycetota bacterium]
MKSPLDRRFWLLAIAIAGVCIGVRRLPAPHSVAANEQREAGSGSAVQFVGAGSCSASACHNANFARGATGSEFTTWMARDRHAKAHETLFDERSARIQKNRQTATPAQDDRRCLGCHVAPEFGSASPSAPAYFKTDGVSCESCHGPAKRWLPIHHLDAWQRKSPARKKQLGMNDTQSLVGRAQVCVACHVGAPGMEVDHDLIAAGHPRLHFEFAAYHGAMPGHWSAGKDYARVNRARADGRDAQRGQAEFEARAWLVGQLVTAHAALELLADRAGDQKKTWPEFADFDCAACHHDLWPSRPKSKSAQRGRKPGSLSWGHHVALTPMSLDALRAPARAEVRTVLAELQKIMDAGPARRIPAAKHATQAAAMLRAAIARLDGRTIRDASLEVAFLQLVAEQTTRHDGPYDERMQIHLGLEPLRRALGNGPRAPTTGLSVREFDPLTLRRRLELPRK